MTGPRIYPDNTAVSRTPRPTKGLGDLLKKILYDNPKANIASLRDPVDPATIDEFLKQAAMGSVGSMGKVGGEAAEFTASRIPASLKRILGIENDEALTRMTKPELEDSMYRAADDLSRAKRGYGLENPADAAAEQAWLDHMDPNGFERELAEDYFAGKRAGKGQGGRGFDKEYELYRVGGRATPRVKEMLRKKWLKENRETR